MLVFQRYAIKHKQAFNVYYNHTLKHYSILAEHGLTPYELQAEVYETEQDARQAIINWDSRS